MRWCEKITMIEKTKYMKKVIQLKPTSNSSPVVLHISSIKPIAPASPHKWISSACSPRKRTFNYRTYLQDLKVYFSLPKYCSPNIALVHAHPLPLSPIIWISSIIATSSVIKENKLSYQQYKAQFSLLFITTTSKINTNKNQLNLQNVKVQFWLHKINSHLLFSDVISTVQATWLDAVSSVALSCKLRSSGTSMFFSSVLVNDVYNDACLLSSPVIRSHGVPWNRRIMDFIVEIIKLFSKFYKQNRKV